MLLAPVIFFLTIRSTPIWWEAEAPASTNFPPPEQNPFAPANATEAAVLSGGKWIGAPETRSETLFLEYTVDVPAAGTYQFYARKFWQHGPFRFRFNDGGWTNVGESMLLDDAYIRQFTGANWIHAGAANLKAGQNRLRIELLENKGAAAFDAFVLSPGYFQPRGKLKPSESYPAAPEGWFNFDPPTDPFKASAIDLRFLNEKFAGEHGVIRAKGDQFVHESTGEPVKFWAINTGHSALQMDDLTLATYARSLAKQGVNMIRLHGPAFGDDLATVPQDKAERIARFVSAMKKEGIYTTLSIYFPLWMQPKGGAAFAGFNGDKHPFATLYFNDAFQKQYRGWWTQLLNTKGADGVALKDEPAVALLEMVNEDSTMFWTFTPYENIPAEQMAIIEVRFGEWLTKKYGSVQTALSTWAGPPVKGDDASAGRAGFVELWRIFSEKTRRGKDTAEFLTGLQTDFYQHTYVFLRKDMGFKGSIYASNWITANAQILGPLDKWSNTVADVMDRHGYFSAPHEGPRAGYSISPGDKYADQSALMFKPAKAGDPPDFSLPIFDIQYNGKPSICTEVNWTPPNRYRADFPLVASAYGSLQGSDATYFFASDAPTWESTLNKFGIRTPVVAGQFPAAAYMYRKNLIKTGPVVAEANLSLASLFNLDGTPVQAPQNLDELRKADIPDGQSGSVDKLTSIDPLSFLVGRVAMNFGTDAPSKLMNLGPFIDHSGKMVKSATRELTWDYANGRVTIDAPSAQGGTGFLNGWNLKTRDFSFSLPLEYGSVLVVSLDGKPISSSKRMLLQVMSEEKPTGWAASEGDMKTITSVGQAPLIVRNLAGSVKWNFGGKLKATRLDVDGYPVKTANVDGTLTLDPATFYYLLER
jgi:hypothetical protein